MKIYIDGEWNSFGGPLISLALVAEDGQEWHEVLRCVDPHPWVAENVIPKLGKPHIPRYEFLDSLQRFLNKFDSIHIVADWPEDIAHFCTLLITGPGERMDTPPLTMEVVRIDAGSANPHNALADARGLKDALHNSDSLC